ncbi:MAG: hypothetical protein FWE37_07565 [Spirochaetaceae bacterium]|nr:hypothetical protein [Spirochaetaceae bacterium]
MEKIIINKKFLIRLVVALLGAFLIGFGGGVALTSGLGSDPFRFLWWGVNQHLPAAIQGNFFVISIIMNVFIILVILPIERREIGIVTVLGFFAMGLGMDLSQPLVPFIIELEGQSFILHFLVLLIGFVILAIGSGFSSYSPHGKAAYIALTFAIVRRFNLSNPWIAKIRMSTDATNTALAVILFSLASFDWQQIVPMMIGPLVAVLIIGPMLRFFYNLFGKVFPILRPE